MESPAPVQSAFRVVTHEDYILRVREIATSRLNAAQSARLLSAKLVYGAGRRHRRGNCFHDAWLFNDEGSALVEICAFGEESKVQLAGTTLHELGHCLAGYEAGHGPKWRRACEALGLIRCRATGQAYNETHFDPEVWASLVHLPDPSDGAPAVRANRQSKPTGSSGHPTPAKLAPCPLGYGTQGGKSRGPGSGSRLRLYMCECPEPPNKARVASDNFNAQCLNCGSKFQLIEAVERPMRKIRSLGGKDGQL